MSNTSRLAAPRALVRAGLKAATGAALAISISAAALAQMSPPPRLTIERLNSDPALSGPRPRGVAFSPDGALVSFLRPKDDDFETLDLWAYDLAAGEAALLVDSAALVAEPADLSEAEKARRERMRIVGGGIVSYDWDAEGRALLAPIGGDITYVDMTGEDAPAPRQLTRTDGYETDARVSPRGRYVSYVRDQNLYAYDLEADAELPISADGGDTLSYGVAEFVAQEEMYRFTGYWWSPDDARLAYTRVDESGVDVVQRFDIGAEGVNVVAQRYPRAGRPNATVQLFVRAMTAVEAAPETESEAGLDAAGAPADEAAPITGETAEASALAETEPEAAPAHAGDIAIPLTFDSDHYLARVDWLDADTLIVQRQTRAQDRLDVVRVDLEPDGPQTSVLFSEASPTWVNLHSDFTPIDDGARFLWTSERSGFRHIYLYEADGTLVRQVTDGDWAVAETSRTGGALVGVDETNERVFFAGFKDTWLEQHLYAVSYGAPNTGTQAEPERLTAPGGWWSPTMAPDAQSFVASFSSPDQPTQVGVYALDGTRLTWIEANELDEFHPYKPYLPRHVTPRFGTIPARDGTPLQYSILRPSFCTASAPCPAIQLVYGGPGAQTVKRNWTSETDQFYAQAGFVVFRLDNRGMMSRGKAFEDALHKAMGQVEVADQLSGANFLKGLDYVDADRIGVFGWSYGGYMTLHMLAQHPGVWAAGVAGAPVSDWSLYDTHYTERYMGMPDAEEEAYASASVFAHLDDLSDPLLMFHGMADDNVAFTNSTRVYSALQEAGAPFEVMVYPGQRHGIRGKARRSHMQAHMMDFLTRHLAPEPEL